MRKETIEIKLPSMLEDNLFMFSEDQREELDQLFKKSAQKGATLS